MAIVKSIALLSLGIQISDALHISNSVLRRTASRGKMMMKAEIAPRKVNRHQLRILLWWRSRRNRTCFLSVDEITLQALFFEIVESGLNDRFKVDQIPRVFKFCQYAKSEIPAPSAKVLKV